MQSWYANTTNPDRIEGDGKRELAVLVHRRAFDRRLLNSENRKVRVPFCPTFTNVGTIEQNGTERAKYRYSPVKNGSGEKKR